MKPALALLFALVTPALLAAEPPPPEPSAPVAEEAVERIKVESIRDPALVPYRDAYDFLAKFERAPHDKVELILRVKSSEAGVKPSDIRINLVGDTIHRPVPVAEDGRIEIPHVPEALSDNAEFIANRKSKTLELHVELEPKLAAADQLTYADMVDSVEQVNHVMREIVPWYFRMLMLSPNALRVCFESADAHPALITNGAETPLKLKTDKDGHCALVAAKRTRLGEISAVKLQQPYTLKFARTSLLGFD